MACSAALPARPGKIFSFAESGPLRYQARRGLKFSRAMSSALNHRAEAATVSRIEAQPITPGAPERLEHAAMRQTWKRLTFLHWPYDPELVRPLLPEGVELDTFDNTAWVGLVPFEIYNFPGL